MDDTLLILQKQEFLTVDIGDNVRYHGVDYSILEISRTKEYTKIKICNANRRTSQLILTMYINADKE